MYSRAPLEGNTPTHTYKQTSTHLKTDAKSIALVSSKYAAIMKLVGKNFLDASTRL